MWLAGYASRDRPSDGTLHDLWAKVLVLEDSLGTQSVLVTADIIGFPKLMTDRIRTAIANKHGLKSSQIILNSSHTHSGPVLKDALSDYFEAPISAAQRQRIEEYSNDLEKKIIATISQTLGQLRPAKVSYGNGTARFQVNRRNNSEATVTSEATLKGPNDYSVPVLKVEGRDGRPIAVVFGYACHTTVLSIYKWSGDYAGFAQIDLEKAIPGTTAMFFQGAGADQNPIPRRTIALAEQYGATLAATVSAVTKTPMTELKPILKTGYKEINLPLGPIPTKEELLKVESTSKNYTKKWARRLIDQLEKGEALPKSYPHYPVQIWKLGDLNWVTMGGEVVIEYALKIKELFGKETFVLGYSNDMMAYIPSLKVLREGGYEGATSQVYFKGMSSTWDPGIETRILHGIIDLASEMEVPLKNATLIGQ